MNLLKKYGIFIYLIVLITHCAFIYFDLEWLRFYSKIVLVPFLLLIYYLKYEGIKNKLYILPFIALVGSFMGDLLLAFEGSQFFLWGMLGFMVTHICNGYYFYSLHKLSIKQSKTAWVALLLLSIICSIVVYSIKDNLGAFLIPIIIYIALISIMAILASNLADSKLYKYAAVHYFIPGAILFVLSDGLLAINKFKLQDPSLDIFVMLTYGLAQLYLVMGYYKTKP